MKQLFSFLNQHKGIIWHYTWRILFVLFLVWAQINHYITQFQLGCLACIFLLIAAILFNSAKRDRQKQLDMLEGKNQDDDNDDDNTNA